MRLSYYRKLNRRDFVGHMAAAAGAGVLGSSSSSEPDPDPTQTYGMDHIIIVTMENRSFDHLLGWVPGADGKQAGLSYTDFGGVARSTHHLTQFQSCEFADPNHSFEGGRQNYNNGACDGWLRTPGNDLYTIGYFLGT